MFTHDQIWQAIDRLAQSHNYSASGLAKKAGLDPTTFNKSKRLSADGKPRWPSTESISKILAVTGASMSEFLSLIDGGSTGGQSVHRGGSPQEVGIVPGDIIALHITGDDEVLAAALVDLTDDALAIRSLDIPFTDRIVHYRDIGWIARLVWTQN